MWLEETVWLWAPLISAAVLWTIWRMTALATEVRSLRMRVAELERVHSEPVARWSDASSARTAA
jgi:hypothetical protein